jgi:hypothetical protein
MLSAWTNSAGARPVDARRGATHKQLTCRVFKAALYRLGEDWIELVYAAEDLSGHSFDRDDVRSKRLGVPVTLRQGLDPCDASARGQA